MVTFAIVTRHLVPGLKRRFEIHADGCRDLKSLVGGQPYDTRDARTAGDALAIELAARNANANVDVDAGEVPLTEADFLIQACCQPNRLRAAGRVRPDPVAETEPVASPVTESVEELIEELVADAVTSTEEVNA